MNFIFNFVLANFRIIELFVFWYPITMGLLWMIGSVIYYFRIEKKEPLPLYSTPMVSVLVPAYNEGNNIATTIEKLNNLNYPNYEVIIINDGSSDDSPKLIKQLAAKYEKVRFVDLKENCGKANALYLGFLAAQGEYLVCVDGDSYLDKDCLRYMISHFVNPNNGERVGAVTGNPRVRNRSSLLSKIQLCEYASIISMIKRCQRIWGKVMTVSGVVVAYRKQALIDCGLWDRDLITEDIGVTWKLERNFWDIRYEPRAICWMLVPETIKGLYRQRKRWAQGGQEVMMRHTGIFKSWKRRRMYPIFAEQVLSLIWVAAWLLLTLTELIRLCYDANSYIPYLWKSQYIAVICVLQFVLALFLERQYDKEIFRNMIVAAWYPAIYWILNGLVSLAALPSSIASRKKKLATWTSPDRGIGTEDKREEYLLDEELPEENSDITPGNASIPASAIPAGAVPVNNANQAALIMTEATDESSKKKKDEDIIKGKQKPWKKVLEIIVTILAWAFILVYVIYCIYGGICLASGKTPVSIFIYNTQMLYETGELLRITFIIFLVEVIFMIFWKEYNRINFGGLKRRKFKPDVSMEQMAEFFTLDKDHIEDMQEQDYTVLERNIIPEDLDKTKHHD